MPFAGMRLFAKWVLADGLKAADTSLLQNYKDYEIDFSASTLTLSSLSYTTDLWDGGSFFFIQIFHLSCFIKFKKTSNQSSNNGY